MARDVRSRSFCRTALCGRSLAVTALGAGVSSRSAPPSGPRILFVLVLVDVAVQSPQRRPGTDGLDHVHEDLLHPNELLRRPHRALSRARCGENKPRDAADEVIPLGPSLVMRFTTLKQGQASAAEMFFLNLQEKP